MANRTKLTPEKKEQFLDVLSDGSSVTAAAKAIGISRTCVYEHRVEDKAFASAWDDAVEAGTDALEDEAVLRAKNSSDTLLIFLLKGRRPEKFKDRQQIEGQITVNISERLERARERASKG